MSNELVLRNVANDDLPIFFEYQLDQEANYMAAFTAEDLHRLKLVSRLEFGSGAVAMRYEPRR